jgi:hypothetical protein
MIAAFLAALPTLLTWVPELARVISAALGGGQHPYEDAWAATLPHGLKDTLDALRDDHTPTVTLVRSILDDIGGPNDALHLAIAKLRSGAV